MRGTMPPSRSECWVQTIYQRSPVYVMSTKNGIPGYLGRKLATPFINDVGRNPPPFPVYVEGGPPTDIADRVGASIPPALAILLHQRTVKKVAAADK